MILKLGDTWGRSSFISLLKALRRVSTVHKICFNNIEGSQG